MYTIYCHVFPNGKKYVGITKRSVEHRWDNGRGYQSCHLVRRAIQKYGWENVEHEALGMVETKEEAEIMERLFIIQFNCNNPRYGYNILPGGDVSTNAATEEMRFKLGNGWRGKHRSEEEKKNISDGVKKTFQRKESNGHFGMHASEETKKKMSESHKKQWENNDKRRKGASERLKKRFENEEFKKQTLERLKRNPPKHGPLSEETKEKLSKAFTGRWVGENSPCSKPVLQFTNDGQFVKRWATARDAQRAGIAFASNIQKVCNHYPHCFSAGGYKWEYES